MEGIQCSDPGLQAAMASVQMDDGGNGVISKRQWHIYCPMTPLQGNEQQAQSDPQQISRTLRASMVQMQVQSKYLKQQQRMET